MTKTVLLVPAAVLALVLGACSGRDSGAAKADGASAASAAPAAASQPGTPSVDAAATAPAPTGEAPGAEHPVPPPVPESHGSAVAYSDCMAHANAAKSEDERALLLRTCTRMKPR
jgi:hypothetical protein